MLSILCLIFKQQNPHRYLKNGSQLRTLCFLEDVVQR